MKTISEPAAPMGVICAAVEPFDRLHLRQWHERDAEVLASAWHDADISQWNPIPPDPSVEFAGRWIRGTAAQTVASVGIDVVLVDEHDDVLGEIGLQVDPAQNVAELGFWLHADARGRGLGRALLVLAERLGEQLELTGLVALVDPANDPATTLLGHAAWSEVPTKSDRRAFARRIA